MTEDHASYFSQINVIVGFASSLLGLITGSGAAMAMMRKLYSRRTANYLEQIDHLEKLLKAKVDTIRLLEESNLAVARTALEMHDINVKQENYAQAIASLEQWFEIQRLDIGQIAKHLAEHYVSYSESEVLRDALARAERAASLASICLDDPKEVGDLLNEIQIIAAENPSVGLDARFQRALDVIEDFAGSSSPDETSSFIDAAIKRAKENLDSGHYWIALHIARRAHRVATMRLQAEDTTRIKSLTMLAVAFFYVGRFSEAEPLAREVLAIYEKALGAEHPETATSLNNLASLLLAQGDYAGAKPLCERALAIDEKALGAEHPETATSLNNVASLLLAQGDYAGAKPLYERALAIREKAQGAEHPETATSLNNFASLLLAQGDYAGAKPLYGRTLAIREKALGAEHPATKTLRENLSRLTNE